MWEKAIFREKRIIGGARANARGKSFEELMRSCATMRGWDIINIPPGCKTVRTHRNPKGWLVRVPTPFDFVFIKDARSLSADSKPSVLFCDVKTVMGATFAFSQIEPHQVDSLMKAENRGFFAGYIINFEKLNATSFILASTLKKLRSRESVEPKDGINLGTNEAINLDLLLSQAGFEPAQSITEPQDFKSATEA